MTLFLARIRLWALSWRSAPWASERSAGGRGPAAHLPGEQTPTPARRQNWDKTAVLVLGASLHQSLFSTRGLETTVPQAVPRDHCPRAKEVILLPRACPTVTIPISLTPHIISWISKALSGLGTTFGSTFQTGHHNCTVKKAEQISSCSVLGLWRGCGSKRPGPSTLPVLPGWDVWLLA